MKKALVVLLALAMLLGVMNVSMAEDLVDNRPTLKFLVGGRTYDPNLDIANNYMMELSGYKIEYEMLPTTGGDEKLMLEMSSGTEYDIVELYPTMFGKLANIGVLTPLDTYIEKYGNYLVAALKPAAWDAAKDASGAIVALPREKGTRLDSAFGTRSSRFMLTKPEIMEELGLSVPTDLDSFTAFLQAIKDAKGVAPLTAAGAGEMWQKDIMTAFGLPDMHWVETEEGFMSIVEYPEFREYIRYMADLYANGLLDPDTPINKGENKNQKFTTDGAYVAQYAFWDIPSLVPGLQASGLSTDLVCFEQPLMDKNGQYVVQTSYGIEKYYGVPVTSKVPEHVVNYFNLISEPETFKITHIGYEDVHHYVDENGNYLPILPTFNDLNWANQFCGLQLREEEFKQWQARARKTPEMAVAYEAINSNLPNANLIIDRQSLASGLPEVQANIQAVNTMVTDFMLQCVVDNVTDDAHFDNFVARLMAEGGKEMKEALTAWALVTEIVKPIE